MNHHPHPPGNASPRSEDELLRNAAEIAGKTLRQIAARQNLEVPDGQRRHKGWVGRIIEQALGATAGSSPEPDFQALGIELKTLPLGKNGRPKESTFVCVVNLSTVEASWEKSLVRRKLARVLWMPVEADPDIPLAARRVGSPLLWSPSARQQAVLRQDWRELMDMVAMGELEHITAHQGQYLQIRPKAANAAALSQGIDASGAKILTLPRGFYLRPGFTRQILTGAAE